MPVISMQYFHQIYLFLLALMYKLKCSLCVELFLRPFMVATHEVQNQIYTYVTNRIQSDFKAGASQFYLLAKCFIKK